MNPSNNPFAPGAGTRPPELAGRDDILNDVKISYTKASRGLPSRSFMFTGLRGVGKTVLLNEIARIADESGHVITSSIESPERERLADLLYPLMGKVLRQLSAEELAKDVITKAFGALKNFARGLKVRFNDIEITIGGDTPGIADSGNIEYDLPDMFVLIGQAAQKANQTWLLLIDEVQYLSEQDLSALIVAMHKISQRGLPVVFVGAGLPQIARLAGEAKSYSERLFDWRRIGALSPEATKQAVIIPLQSQNADIKEDALEKFVTETEGYPFFIQTLAFQSWLTAKESPIKLEDVQKAQDAAIKNLDEGFFRVRFERLTDREIDYVKIMAMLGEGPYLVSDIRKKSKESTAALSKQRDGLIKKGMIFSPKYGYVDFTVPLFAEFLSRNN